VDKTIVALAIQEGSKFVSELLRVALTNKPRTSLVSDSITHVEQPHVMPSSNDKDISYRFECLAKHLGGASVLLREAYERANDEGVGEGTSEKVLEAMNEHSASEADIEHMIGHPIAKRLLSGIRGFRKACWEAKLPTGGGSIQDIEDARTWNSIMYKETIEAAKVNPGSECVISGM